MASTLAVRVRNDSHTPTIRSEWSSFLFALGYGNETDVSQGIKGEVILINKWRGNISQYFKELIELWCDCRTKNDFDRFFDKLREVSRK